MSLPGPTGLAWAGDLVIWAASATVLGEAIRWAAARWVVAWRRPIGIERALLGFYLGGAALYLVAALPIGAFVEPVTVGLPVAGAAVVVTLGVRFARRPVADRDTRPAGRGALVGPIGALAAALGLLVFELAIALPIGTGNTYDSSLLTLYVTSLLGHHTIPLSYAPFAPFGLSTPQATTVWLGWAQLWFRLPPARTSLLVTPLFFALAPLAAYVFGRRFLGTEAAGLGLALTMTLLAAATRGSVAGSNDFVFAFPLVLLLGASAVPWLRGELPGVADAVGFGLLVGYSAALNPVGAEWLLPSVLIGTLVARRTSIGAALAALGRWAIAVGVALVAVIPSLYVIALSGSNPELTPGGPTPPAGATFGVTLPQLLGGIDPYLFRPTDVLLSPIPLLRLEIAILLTAGLAMLVATSRRSSLGRYLSTLASFVAISGVVVVLLFGALALAGIGFAPAVRFTAFTRAAELSAWLFTFYTLVAALPLVLALERLFALGAVRSEKGTAAPVGRPRAGRIDLPRGLVPVLITLVILVPGLVATTSELPPVLTRLYTDFGNVSADDFALLAYAGAHLPAGARVLVAPGSAAEFLPGYAPNLVLLYPLAPGFTWVNASYTIVVSQLTNGTLTASGLAALAVLDVEYIAVTGANTVLWPPFSPAPLLADPTEFPVLWNAGPDYLFARSA